MKSRWDWLLWASCLASGFFLFQYPTWTQWCFGTCFVPITNWGIYKLQREHSEYTDEVLNHFLDGFLLSRIGSNMLLDQHPNYKEGFAMISCFFKVLGKSLEHCAAVFGALQFFSLRSAAFLPQFAHLDSQCFLKTQVLCPSAQRSRPWKERGSDSFCMCLTMLWSHWRWLGKENGNHFTALRCSCSL